MKPRKLRPREPITIAPVLISQHTSLPIAGMAGRRFLDFVREHGVKHTRVGKLVLVEAETLRALVRDLAREDVTDDAPASESDEPTTAEQVLARIGRRKTA